MDSTTNMFPVMRLYSDILRELRCPICNDYWKRRPIEMCEEGHNICHRCQAHIPSSASCGAQPSNLRNITLENIVANAIYLCPFALSEGAPCPWSGIPFDIEDHVRDSHDSEEFKGNGQSEWIRLSLPLVGPFQKAIFTLDNLFFPVSSIREGKLYFSVFHVGHKDNSNNYRYDFRIQKSDDPQKSHSEKGGVCHNYLKSSTEIEVSHEYVMLSIGSIQKYLTDIHAVSCDITIRITGTREDDDIIERREYKTQWAESSKYTPDDRYIGHVDARP